MDTKSPILVTGASGYVASWIIKGLLEKGYTVRGTVRNLSKIDRYEHLEKIAQESKGEFVPIEADLLSDGAFDDAVKDCEIVIHTASPFIRSKVKDAYKELINPALMGTENVLNAVNKSESVKKVVLTSSVVAIYGDAVDLYKTKNQVFTEEYWNETSDEHHQQYSYSKKLAEEKAWEMAGRQDRWKLVVINPGFVLGPSLTTRVDSTSISTVLDFLNGKLSAGAPELNFGVVDVRNIADAHIEAAFSDSAEGRNILVGDHTSLLGMGERIEENFPQKYKLPKSTMPKFMAYMFGPFIGMSWKYISKNVGVPLRFDNSKSIDKLNITYRPFTDTMRDHVAQLEEDGLVGKK